MELADTLGLEPSAARHGGSTPSLGTNFSLSLVFPMSKIIQIIAGPNGSGKTTFAETYINNLKSNIAFLNPDLIASGFGTNDFEKASFLAGRVLLSDIKDKINKGESFAFESTLSGLTYARIIKHAKLKGYKIVIYFVFLNKISLNISRIKKRVSMGGHFIPTKIVKRRYLRCFDNFWNLYKDLSDEWSILDNSGNKPKLKSNHLNYNSLAAEEKNKFAANFLKGKL